MSDAIDPFARHLAFLLSVVDVEARLRRESGGDDAVTRALSLVRRASGATRVSLFEIEGDAPGERPPVVTRIARVVERDDAIAPLASFTPSRVALVLACAQTGTPEAVGPFGDDEPFYAEHAMLEPQRARYAAFAPVLARGHAAFVLEAARGDDGPPFDGDALNALDDGAVTIGEVIARNRRERTVEALFADILPELFDPERSPTSLASRLRAWASERHMAPRERETLSLAIGIAELATLSPGATSLAHSIVAAVVRTFANAGPSREQAHARR